MALIFDPDDLTDGATDDGSTEVFIDVATKTIKLNITGNLSNDGVVLKALYSFLKEEWRNDPNNKSLTAYPFPMVPITDESYEFVDGWDYSGDASRYLIRTGGWTVRNTSGSVTQKWAGIIGLGDIGATDQIYFNQGAGAVSAQLTGQINQAVQIYSDPDGDGSVADGFDNSGAFTLYVREQGKVYSQSSISDIGVPTMDAQAYRFPLSTATDLKIVAADTAIDASGNGVADVAPYDGMSIVYHETPQAQDIGGTNYDFGVTIDGNNGTAEEIYEFVQWSLRQTADLDADADAPIQSGNLSDSLLKFVGDNLETISVNNEDGGGSGVYINNFQPVDKTRISFADNTDTNRAFPFDAVLSINFNENLVNDGSSRFWVYMSDPNGAAGDGDEWDTSGALLLEDTAAADITGDVAGNATLQYSVAYDTNTQGSHTAGNDIQVTVVALGLDTGQYVRANGTITRSVSNSISLVAPLERNYANV